MEDCVVHLSGSSRLTLEQERDSYKEKMMHLRLMVRDLQQKLEVSDTEKRGTETVMVLLKEARQNIVMLKNQKKALETAVRNLQNRLLNNGLTDTVTLEENELFVPGSSKQILDNLAKENTRLQNLLENNRNVQDAPKLSEAQTMASNLQTERDNLLLEVSNLQNTIKTSDQDKDKVIDQLRAQIDSRETPRPESSLGEITKLREQLKDVVIQCQHLQVKLEEEGKSSLQLSGEQGKDEEADVPDGNILQEENTRLKGELKTLKEMNRRWQQHNNERERHIQDLQGQYRDLEHKYSAAQENMISKDSERSLKKLLITANEKFENMASEKQKVDELVTVQQAKLQTLSSEITHLRQVEGADPATIIALKAQIQLCMEDFQTERGDRAKAWAKVHQLTSEVKVLRQENDQLKNHLRTATPPSISQPLTPQLISQPFLGYNTGDQGGYQLKSRGILPIPERFVSDGSEDRVDAVNTDYSSLDRIYRPNTRGSGPMSLPALRHPSAQPKDQDTLCCPKCGREFHEEERNILLKHIADCCE